jgi:hypothetical protein
MKAVIKSFSTSEENVAAHELDGAPSFSFLLTFGIGPAASEGEDSFEVLVVSPASLQEYFAGSVPTFIRHVLLMPDYDVPAAVAHVSKYINLLEADTWLKLATSIDQMLRWECEDYCSRQ